MEAACTLLDLRPWLGARNWPEASITNLYKCWACGAAPSGEQDRWWLEPCKPSRPARITSSSMANRIAWICGFQIERSGAASGHVQGLILAVWLRAGRWVRGSGP